jgi:hypothetical protein
MASCWGCVRIFSISKEMNVTNVLAKMIAFSPPSRMTYDIKLNDESNERGTCYKKINFIHSEHKEISYPWIEIDSYQLQKCSTKKKIVLLHIKNKNNNNKENKITIIFSHGNSCDLGVIYPFLIDMSTQLKVRRRLKINF